MLYSSISLLQSQEKSVKYFMPIIVDARLTEPPSWVCSFRDTSMYVSIFIKKSVLVECDQSSKDIYYQWLKKYGALDFVEEIVSPGEEVVGFRIGLVRANLIIDKLVPENLSMVLSRLDQLRL